MAATERDWKSILRIVEATDVVKLAEGWTHRNRLDLYIYDAVPGPKSYLLICRSSRHHGQAPESFSHF